jgi:hypothetical protein
MNTIIHTPADIKIGKLYKPLFKQYKDNTIYLGCGQPGEEKFLVVVVDDANDGYFVGRKVRYDNPSSLWNAGFEEQIP